MLSAEQAAIERELRPQLGQVVQAEREARGLTQEQLAERAGIHWTTVGKIERGLQLPSLALLILIARALGIHTVDLLAKAPAVGASPGEDELLAYVRAVPVGDRERLLPIMRGLVEWRGGRAATAASIAAEPRGEYRQRRRPK